MFKFNHDRGLPSDFDEEADKELARIQDKESKINHETQQAQMKLLGEYAVGDSGNISPSDSRYLNEKAKDIARQEVVFEEIPEIEPGQEQAA